MHSYVCLHSHPRRYPPVSESMVHYSCTAAIGRLFTGKVCQGGPSRNSQVEVESDEQQCGIWSIIVRLRATGTCMRRRILYCTSCARAVQNQYVPGRGCLGTGRGAFLAPQGRALTFSLAPTRGIPTSAISHPAILTPLHG